MALLFKGLSLSQPCHSGDHTGYKNPTYEQTIGRVYYYWRSSIRLLWNTGPSKPRVKVTVCSCRRCAR